MSASSAPMSPLRTADWREATHAAVHARPVTSVAAPSCVTAIAVMGPCANERERLQAHLDKARLTVAAHPGNSDRNFLIASDSGRTAGDDTDLAIRWEAHTEYSLYVGIAPEQELVKQVASWLPEDHGGVFAALKISVLPQAEAVTPELARELAADTTAPWYAERMFGSMIRDTDACALTSYQLDDDGFLRIHLLVGPDVTKGRIGRVVNALIEIETYRLLAMRALPAARAVHPQMAEVEAQLSSLTNAIDESDRPDSELLHELLSLAATVQATMARCDTQFSAALAYADLVATHKNDLRVGSVPGLTGLFTYLERRLDPATSTIESAAAQLRQVSEHITRTGDLLRTRVSIEAEAQNTELLGAIQEGQHSQLRLQEAVEGLSIAAITYYALSLIGYVFKGIKEGGLHLNVDLATALALPVVAGAVWFTLIRAKRKLK